MVYTLVLLFVGIFDIVMYFCVIEMIIKRIVSHGFGW